MNELPDAGDLARVVRSCSCPGADGILNFYGFVHELVPAPYNVGRYENCGALWYVGMAAIIEITGHLGTLPREWLRKVPPLTEDEKIEEQTDAPALV